MIYAELIIYIQSVSGQKGLISRRGEPSSTSNHFTVKTFISTLISSNKHSAMGLGQTGDLMEKTPFSSVFPGGIPFNLSLRALSNQ